jgi:hypothetical protein
MARVVAMLPASGRLTGVGGLGRLVRRRIALILEPWGRRSDAWAATGLYAVLALLLTWPLVRGLARDLPADLADPVLNCWILAWGADHVVRFAAGEWTAFAGFWNGNIFYPEPLTLAYSEHLFAQALQIAPLYALTANIILCYNLLFLSTFVLSGLGAYLLLRDITGDPRAAFAGGLVYAFIPYRYEQMAHLQSMSTQWMPFVFLGLRRFVGQGRPRALAGTAAALTAHNLSCGYYLFFFAPFVGAYGLFEMAAQGRLRDARRWGGLVLCAALVAALSLPFLLPYAELRAREATARTVTTLRQFSADLLAYATATPHQLFWGELSGVHDRPEGHLFPGVTPVVLGLFAVAAALAAAWRALPRPKAHPLPRVAAALAAVVAAWALSGLIPTEPSYPVVLPIPGARVTNLARLALSLPIVLATLAAVSGRVRAVVRRALTSPTAFHAVALAACVWSSLGPAPRLDGREMGLVAPYAWLYRWVPGFDGLRVPARYGALAMFFLALLAGLGLARLRGKRWGMHAVWLAGGVFLLESLCVPLPMNIAWGGHQVYAPPPPGRVPEPPVYEAVRALPPDAVLAELPLGIDLYDTRAMYYSTRHWRRLVNGYSGYFPGSYYTLRRAVWDALAAPDEAWEALVRSGTTHIIVHPWAWTRRQGTRLADLLTARGARLVGRHGEDLLLEMPPRRAPGYVRPWAPVPTKGATRDSRSGASAAGARPATAF